MYLITLPNSSSGEHKYLMYSCIVMMRLVSTLWTCLNYNTLTHNRFHPSVDLRKKKYRKIESLRRWFREIKNIKRKWKVHHTTNLCLFLMIYVETDTSSTEHHWASQTPLNTRGGGDFSCPGHSGDTRRVTLTTNYATIIERHCGYDQTEQINGHMWHWYTIAANQDMKATVKLDH
jgi:hypothetical protein